MINRMIKYEVQSDGDPLYTKNKLVQVSDSKTLFHFLGFLDINSLKCQVYWKNLK